MLIFTFLGNLIKKALTIFQKFLKWPLCMWNIYQWFHQDALLIKMVQILPPDLHKWKKYCTISRVLHQLISSMFLASNPLLQASKPYLSMHLSQFWTRCDSILDWIEASGIYNQSFGARISLQWSSADMTNKSRPQYKIILFSYLQIWQTIGSYSWQ